MSTRQRPSSRRAPGSLYVFVVLFLAAFLALFLVWRTPGITYDVQADVVPAPPTFSPADSRSPEMPEASFARIRERLTRPDQTLAALQTARLASGETPRTKLIAEALTARLASEVDFSVDGRPCLRITLRTQHPESAMKILDQLATNATEDADLLAAPARVVGVRGGSLGSGGLFVVVVLSTIVGFAGVYLAERAAPGDVLYSRAEVAEVSGLPVVLGLEPENQAAAAQIRARSCHQRFLRGVLAVAECGIAALFLLVVLQVATQRAFGSRLCSDPLAACGEVLTRTLG